MHTSNGRGSRGNAPAKRRPSPEQTAVLHELALKWRNEWRAGKLAASLPEVEPKGDPAPVNGQARHRAQFAQAIARLEFGRNYWDGRLQREVNKPKASVKANSKASSPKLPRNGKG
jgi:hypothetical protein